LGSRAPTPRGACLAVRAFRLDQLSLVWAGRLLFDASWRTLVARRSPCSFRRRGCRSSSCGAVGLARALSRSISAHSPQQRSHSLPVACVFDVAQARRSQSRGSCGIVDLVSMINAVSRRRQVAGGAALALASSSCSPLVGAALLAVMGRLLCDCRMCVCVCSPLAARWCSYIEGASIASCAATPAWLLGGRRLHLRSRARHAHSGDVR